MRNRNRWVLLLQSQDEGNKNRQNVLGIFMTPSSGLMTKSSAQEEREKTVSRINVITNNNLPVNHTDTCHGLRRGSRWSLYDRLFGFLFEEQPLHGDLVVALIVTIAVMENRKEAT
jgi:hypothetical protein